MSWDSLGKTINTFVEERLLSPLLGTFVISWCAWNYRFMVILLSEESVATTFRMIETYAFPDLASIFLRGMLFPLLTTLAYVYIYPWPARVIFEAWRKTQLDIATIRRKYDEETPVSHAEARELRAARYAAEEELEQAQQQLAQLRRDFNELRRAQQPGPAAVEPAPQAGPSPTKTLMRGKRGLPPDEQQVLKLLEGLGGAANNDHLLQQIQKVLGVNLVQATYLMEELLHRDLAERNFNEDREVIALTQDGRRLLYAAGNTENVAAETGR